MTRDISLVAVCVLIASVVPVSAQEIQAPGRNQGLFGERPPDTQRNRRELTGQANFLGGFDDNLSPGDTAGPFTERDSGYAAASNGSLRYYSGRDGHSFEVSGRGAMNAYKGTGPSYGTYENASAQLRLGRRSDLNVSQGFSSMPFFALGVFAPLASDLGQNNPDTNPSNGVAETRASVLDATVRLTHPWTRRFSSDVSYGFNSQMYSEGLVFAGSSAQPFDSHTHVVSVSAERAVGRNSSLNTSYHFSDSLHTESNGLEMPERDHTIDGGFEHTRNLSRTRMLAYSFGTGAIYVDTLDSASRVPLSYWSPSGYGTLTVDLSRTWNVSANYRRGVSVIRGIVPQSFISDTVSVRTGGSMGSRAEAAFIVGYGNGQTGEDASGWYEGYTGTAQLRIRINAGWAAVANVNHYEYRLSNNASASLGVPHRLHRNAVWAGVTWAGPVYRAYMRGPAN